MAKKNSRLLTTPEAAEMLGYGHVESFRRALRDGNLPLLYPPTTRSKLHSGSPYMFEEHLVQEQLKDMPTLGRPRALQANRGSVRRDNDRPSRKGNPAYNRGPQAKHQAQPTPNRMLGRLKKMMPRLEQTRKKD